MSFVSEELLEKHIKSHSENADIDRKAVIALQNVLLHSNGKFCCVINSTDTWPNTDGKFELVANPTKSRIPSQNFCVQVKGTTEL